MMLMFMLLIAITLPQEGEQQLTWKQRGRKSDLGERIVLQCNGSQLQTNRTIGEVLVRRNDSDESNVLSHCLRANGRCEDHEQGINVYPVANFLNFKIVIDTMTLLHIGDYSCEFYDEQRTPLGTKYTYVDVSVPPDLLQLFMDDILVPKNEPSIAVTAGKSVSLMCSTISRPAVQISWEYPKWLSPEHNESQGVINRYLTEVNATATFTMESVLQKKVLRCKTSPFEGDHVILQKDVELQVLDPPSELSVFLFHLKKESMRDGQTLTTAVKEDNTLICSMLSRTNNAALPHWNIPSSMTDAEVSSSNKTYPYHHNFTVSTVRLNFKGSWMLHNTAIECISHEDNESHSIQLLIQVEGYSQHQSFLVASVAIATTILVGICCLTVGLYLKKRRSPVSELHHTYMAKKDSSMIASFRRSLPPVPGYALKRSAKDQLSMVLSKSYSNIYEAISDAEERGRLDVIPNHEICFTLELSASRNTRRWLGSFVSGGNTKEVLITCVDDNSNPKLELLWRSYVALILRLPEHQNIIRIFGISHFNDFVYVLQDYIETITLRYHLKTEYLDKGVNKTTILSLLKYAGDVVDGMVFLAEHQCCHPGLSAQKVLVNSKKICKLYDFCAASDATDVLESLNIEEDHDVFPSLPPESLFLGEYTPESDAWSIGVTFWEILSCGEVPYPNVTLKELEGMLRKRKLLERPRGVPSEIFEIMQSCWTQRISRRLGVTAIKQKLETVKSSVISKMTQENDVISTEEDEVECDDTSENIHTDAPENNIYQRTISL